MGDGTEQGTAKWKSKQVLNGQNSKGEKKPQTDRNLAAPAFQELQGDVG